MTANRTISADVASQAEAEAGTEAAKLMTPQRTAQAIAVLSPPPVFATQAEAEAGTVTDKVMSPLRTAEAIAALATGGAVLYNRRPALYRGSLFYKTAATTISVVAGAVLNGHLYAAATAVTMPGASPTTPITPSGSTPAPAPWWPLPASPQHLQELLVA